MKEWNNVIEIIRGEIIQVKPTVENRTNNFRYSCLFFGPKKY